MADIDDDIDRLYRGPLDAFTDQRNALAKTARRPELKKLEKPGLAAWAVNQLHWHHHALLEAVVAGATAVRDEHQRALQGDKADVHTAEQTHSGAIRRALAEVRALLTAGGHPVTPATLEAVRETLRALPASEANGRLVRPLAPKGLEALAGLVVTPRPAPPAEPRAVADRSEEGVDEPSRQRVADRDGERAQAREAAERTERERQARRQAAAAALVEARARLRLAEAAVADAERVVSDRIAERDAALEACVHAERVGEE